MAIPRAGILLQSPYIAVRQGSVDLGTGHNLSSIFAQEIGRISSTGTNLILFNYLECRGALANGSIKRAR